MKPWKRGRTLSANNCSTVFVCWSNWNGDGLPMITRRRPANTELHATPLSVYYGSDLAASTLLLKSAATPAGEHWSLRDTTASCHCGCPQWCCCAAAPQISLHLARRPSYAPSTPLSLTNMVNGRMSRAYTSADMLFIFTSGGLCKDEWDRQLSSGPKSLPTTYMKLILLNET